MLRVLSHLARLHIQIRDHAQKISSSHGSIVCRAVADSISSRQLGDFRRRVIEVEKLVLSKDAGFVGGYGVVPLSTIVGEFAPWSRRLEWLWEVVRFMMPPDGEGNPPARVRTGAEAIDFLQQERYTGYADLEKMATELLVVAEAAWMRQTAAWLLYGRVLDQGMDDFFVQRNPNADEAFRRHTIAWDLVPKTLTPTAAEDALSIGASLEHTRDQVARNHQSFSANDSLLSKHLSTLNGLSYPLSPTALEGAIASIRVSISQNVLAQLLPLSQVTELMDVIFDFVLLARGEFALSLIAQADARVATRQKPLTSSRLAKKAGKPDEITIQKTEAAAVLGETWTDLASLQTDDFQDACFERAQQLLRLEVLRPDTASKLITTIFPSPAALTLVLSENSSLKLFLSVHEIASYAAITSYLLSLRRAELHLGDLWKFTALRRCYPAAVAPPMSATKAGQRTLSTRRAREQARGIRTRKHWAIVAKALFVLSEIDGYLHGEVIASHWAEIKRWIAGGAEKRPGSSGSRPATSASHDGGKVDSGESRQTDPVTLARAHKSCLSAMKKALLLEEESYMTHLQELLRLVDHFVALFSRLQIAWQGLDLQEDEGVVDALTNYKKDEGEVLWDMDKSSKTLDEKVTQIVEDIKGLAGNKSGGDFNVRFEELAIGAKQAQRFIPYNGKIIDRLIMKLEFLTGQPPTARMDDEMKYDDD